MSSIFAWIDFAEEHRRKLDDVIALAEKDNTTNPIN